MAQMRSASGAGYFGSGIPEVAIRIFADIFFCQRLPKARPARTRLVLRLRCEQVVAAANAAVYPFGVIIPILSRERSFGAFLPRNLVRERFELILPFFLGLRDLLHPNECVLASRKYLDL